MRLHPGLGMNPIMVKELRSRMRGARAFVILTATLLLLGTVSYALYRIVLVTSRYSTSPLSPQIGQTLFFGLAFFELMMVCFLTPALTAGAISGEREKLTYEMLLATPLRPASILWGKLISALSYVLLLIFAAIPMASLVFIFGGVAPRDMVMALVILVAVAVMLGVVGIFMSTWLGRTARATVLSYLVVLGLLVAPLLLYALVGVLRMEEPPRWILVPNPMSALFSALTPAVPDNGAAGVFGGLGMVLAGNLSVLSGDQIKLLRPLYHYTLALYGATTLILYLLATRLMQPAHRWRVSWKEALTVLALLLAFGLGVGLVFAASSDRYEKPDILPTPTPAPAIIREVVEVAPPPVPPPAVSPLPTPTPTHAPALLMEEDRVAIYAAVVRQLYTVDHTFGDQPPNFPVVYLVRTTDDSVGDPDAPRTGPSALPESVQTAIVAALDDLPAEFRWVDDPDQVLRENNTDRVADGGAIVTLGNIHVQDDGSTLVSTKLFFAMLGAIGKTYVLEQADGVWLVTGDTGVQWMS